ncbi:hypothetical protein [Mycobacterium deserti]|uniref:Uncharacterized protein n=1 Tax=Mycobacterium deserti TaxID=2978347 RepID=A0ABT2M6Z5_9MYCO|nr:hypothetical protein [Mycobacterium deserti]MCT7658041.1 hypothetical protein [Mycobacterium deserti]
MTTPEGVFINCPFDDEHRLVHHAIVTAVVACGFEPRSALETGSTALPRMQRISHALRSSRYSVHDLSRAFGDPKRSNLARLNMPFELGMAFFHAESVGVRHDWLGLVPSSHPHSEFISDLSGYDLKNFDGTAEGVIPPLLSWLASRVPPLPTGLDPTVLGDLLPDVDAVIAAENLKWGGHLPWIKLVGVVRDLLAAKLI